MVLHISVGQKILETRPDFLTFSAKALNCQILSYKNILYHKKPASPGRVKQLKQQEKIWDKTLYTVFA